jgi:hypothetical protein
MKNVINRGGPIPEDINKDKNSIYLSTDKKYLINNSNDKFSPLEASGNSIIINSDKLIFNGRNGNVNIRASKNLVLEGDEVFVNATKAENIKLGDPRAKFIPTVNSSELVKIIDGIIKAISDGANAFTTETGAGKTIQTLLKLLPDTKNILNKNVKVADPNFKLPDLPKIPEIFEIPEVKLPDISKPDISNIDVDMEKLETLEKIKNL